MGVPHEGRQVRLVGHLAAERDGEAQGVAGGLAQPGGEQGGGRGAFAEAGQREAGGLARPKGASCRIVVVAVEGVLAGAQVVALAQQGAGLDEAQRQALGLEPEVSRPVRLLVGERALHDVLQELDRGAAAETGEEDLFEVGVGAGAGTSGVAARRNAHSGVASSSSWSAAPPNSRSSRTTTAPMPWTSARSCSRSGRCSGAL